MEHSKALLLQLVVATYENATTPNELELCSLCDRMLLEIANGPTTTAALPSLKETPQKQIGVYNPDNVPEKLRRLAELVVPGSCHSCGMAGGKDNEGNCVICGYPAIK